MPVQIMSFDKRRKMEHSLPDDIPVDSAYGDWAYDSDDAAGSNFTVASSTHAFKYENGRRYHAYREGSYPFPNDQPDADHQRIGHHLWLTMFNDKLYLAPIASPKNVIDLGTGIGLWAEDMAERNPLAKVLGTDLSPTQPEALPPNLDFLTDDVREEWTFNEKFDLVHIRLLFGSISDWPAFYATCFENMEPGGYLHHSEMEIDVRCDDGTMPLDSAIKSFTDLAKVLDTSMPAGFTIAGHMRQRIQDAGFVDVTEHRFKLPLGPWSNDPRYKELGKQMEHFFRTGAHGWVVQPLTRNLGWTVDKVSEVVHGAFNALDERNEHTYYEAVVIYARKP